MVASEVKGPANQTANMQQISSDAMAAIQGIGAAIVEINEITLAIASAIEGQGAAGTQAVSSNVAKLRAA